MASKKAIIIHERDNVATALVPLKSGTAVSISVPGGQAKVKIRNPIPMGHKFALRSIEAGQEVVKYGEPIGQATAPIGEGEHVHVHNVVSQRRRKGGV